MKIEKNDIIYNVTENNQSWTITRTAERVDISYNIKKSDCPTFEILKSFINENSVF